MTTTEDDLIILFQNKDYKGRDIFGLDFIKIIVKNTNFYDANLSSANFTGSKVEHCDFAISNLKFSNFDIENLVRCTLEGSEFDGDIIKMIKWDDQVGIAKNVTVPNITFDNNALRQPLVWGSSKSSLKADNLVKLQPSHCISEHHRKDAQVF
jgi:hypothetical protein